MSGLKNLSVCDAQTILESFLRDYEAIYGRDPECKTPGDRFCGLIHRAAKQTGEKVTVARLPNAVSASPPSLGILRTGEASMPKAV